MKIRLTVMTENIVPVETLDEFGNMAEEKIKKAWNQVLELLLAFGNETGERAYVEKVEIVRDASTVMKDEVS